MHKIINCDKNLFLRFNGQSKNKLLKTQFNSRVHYNVEDTRTFLRNFRVLSTIFAQ